MLRFGGDHPSLWDVQRVQWMLAPSCCAWRISCGGHYRYRMCDFPSWLPLKEGNHDSHLLGPEVQVRFVLYLFFLFLFFCFQLALGCVASGHAVGCQPKLIEFRR